MSMIPINVRVTDGLHAKLQKAADAMNLPIADIVRHALALGVADLELLGTDLDQVLHDAVLKARQQQADLKTRPEDP